MIYYPEIEIGIGEMKVLMEHMNIGSLFWIIVYVAVVIVPFWKIFPRAGLPAAASLVMVIPLANVIMLYVLAFKKWPRD